MTEETITKILTSNSRISDEICEALTDKEMEEMSNREVFDAWLRYIGIIGSTDQILTATKLLNL